MMILQPLATFARSTLRACARVVLLQVLASLERKRARLVTIEQGLWANRHGHEAQRRAVTRHRVELDIMELRRRLGLPLMAPRAASVGVRLREVA